MASALDLVGQARIHGPGRLEVRGVGSGAEFRFADLRSLRSFLRNPAVTAGRRVRRRRLLAWARALRHADLRVAVFLGEREVAVLGAGAQPGWSSSLLGLDPLQIRWGTVLGFGRRR